MSPYASAYELDHLGGRAPAAEEMAFVFADVSGYTRLTERLAGQGRHGAEVVTEVVNDCFTRLITAASACGADVVRFGGDALALVVRGEDHRARALDAASDMQRAMRGCPSIAVPGGRVRLRMSMGIDAGLVRAYRWDGRWSQVLPLGAPVDGALRAEAAASAGEIGLGPGLGAGWAPVRRRPSGRGLSMPRGSGSADALAAPSLRGLRGEPEHRPVCVGFVIVTLDDGDPSAALDPVFAAVDDAESQLGVVPVSTDVAPGAVKVVLVTGLPAATEDDEERMVVALGRIVQAAPTRARAGAHAGVVFCGDVGHPERRSYTVMGDAVNLAARLMSAAATGSVLASDVLLDALTGRFELAWRPPFAVKGKRRLQVAAEVGPPRVAGDASETALLGRDVEVGAVARAIGGGGVVTVSGEPGSGADAVAMAGVSAAGRSPMVVRAVVGDADRGWSLAERIAPLPPAAADEDAATRLARVVDALDQALGDDRVLVCLDADHIDASSADALVALADARSRTIVLHRRSGAPGAIEVGPLGDGLIAAIAVEAAGRALSDAELARIVRRASGNPRVARWLASAGLDDEAPPRGLETLAVARLDRLRPAVRQVVRVAAVVGDPLDVELVAELTGRSRAAALAALRRAPGVIEGGERFADDVVRDAAEASLPVRERRVLHARCAAVALRRGEPIERVAGHLWAAGDPQSAWPACRDAGRAAAHRGAGREAIVWFDRARRAARRARCAIEDRAAIARELADVAEWAGEVAVALDALGEATRLTEDAAERATLLARRAVLGSRRGDAAVAARHLTAARRLGLGASTPAGIEVDLAATTVLLDRGDMGGAARAAMEVIGRASDLRQLARANLLAEAALSSLGDGESRRFASAAHEAAVAAGDAPLAALALYNAALTADNRGDWAGALRDYERSARDLDAAGRVVGAALARLGSALIAIELGDVDRATELAAVAGRQLAAASYREGSVMSRVVMARAAVRRDGSGLDALRAAVGDLAPGSDTELYAQAAVLEAEIVIGDLHSARRRAERVSAASAGRDDLLPVTSLRLAAMLRFAGGHLDHATSMLEEALGAAADLPPERCLVAAALARVTGGPPPVAAEAALGVVAHPWWPGPTLVGRA